jgi:hypothetical protein
MPNKRSSGQTTITFSGPKSLDNRIKLLAAAETRTKSNFLVHHLTKICDALEANNFPDPTIPRDPTQQIPEYVRMLNAADHSKVFVPPAEAIATHEPSEKKQGPVRYEKPARPRKKAAT